MRFLLYSLVAFSFAAQAAADTVKAVDFTRSFVVYDQTMEDGSVRQARSRMEAKLSIAKDGDITPQEFFMGTMMQGMHSHNGASLPAIFNRKGYFYVVTGAETYFGRWGTPIPPRDHSIYNNLASDYQMTGRARLVQAEFTLMPDLPAAIKASEEGRALQVIIAYEDKGHRVVIEAPLSSVKTNEKKGTFQASGGPVLVPVLPFAHVLTSLKPAHFAFYSLDSVEFLVEEEQGSVVDFNKIKRAENASVKIFAQE